MIILRQKEFALKDYEGLSKNQARVLKSERSNIARSILKNRKMLNEDDNYLNGLIDDKIKKIKSSRDLSPNNAARKLNYLYSEKRKNAFYRKCELDSLLANSKERAKEAKEFVQNNVL